MKVICQGMELSDAVSKVAKALPLKKMNPILECIKLTAKDDTLTLLATDLELAIEKKIAAEVLIEGEIIVPGKIFTDYCKKIENEEIELDGTLQGKLKIRYLDSEVSLTCLDVEQYPPFKKVSEEKSFTIMQKGFKALVNKIIFCVSVDDSRPALKGCCLTVKGDEVEGVASDGFRLSLCRMPIRKNGIEGKIVIPAKSLSEISRLIDNEEEEMTVYVEKNFIMADLRHTKVVSRLIAEDYIQYDKIIQKDFVSELVVDKKQFENAVERVSLISRNELKSYVRMEIKEDFILLKAQSESGEIIEKIPISLKGQDLVIGFNSKFLLDCMKAISDQYITLNFTSGTAPGIIKGDDKSWLYLVLPLRVIG